MYLDNAEAYLHIGVSEGFSFRESGKVFVLFTKRVRLIHTSPLPLRQSAFFQLGMWT